MKVCKSFTCPCTKELIGQRFVNIVMNWKYALHLDVFLAKNSKCIVIICATCLKSTLKACSLIPPEGNTIHEEWTKCYAIFYNVFEDIKEDFSRKKPINYLHICGKHTLMCNACKSTFICPFKDFFVHFILDEHLFIL